MSEDNYPFLMHEKEWNENSFIEKSTGRLHFHNLLEIGYCYSGEGVVYINKKQFNYSKGTLIIVPKNMSHDVVCTCQKENLWRFLFVDETLLLNSLCTKKHDLDKLINVINDNFLVTNETTDKDLGDTAKQMFLHFDTNSRFQKERVFAGTLSLIYQFADTLEFEENIGVITEEKSVIINVIEYINNNYSEDISVANMAKEFNISEAHFRKMFKYKMKISPLEYLNKIRIKNVCEKLRKTDENIIDIAMSCGYSSVATFNRNFIKYVKCRPNEYRKEIS